MQSSHFATDKQLVLKAICNLQQLGIFANNFFNLLLVYKDIELSYRKSRTRSFFSIVRVVYLTTCFVTHKSFKTFIYNIFRVPIFYENLFWVYMEPFVSECDIVPNLWTVKSSQICVNSSKSWFATDRSGRLFTLTDNLFIKKGPSVSTFLFIFSSKLRVGMSII